MSLDIILAKDSNNGIGKDGKIPWHCPEDLQLFKTLTTSCDLIVGRKTYDTLPHLKDRLLYVATTQADLKDCIILDKKRGIYKDKKNELVVYFKSLDCAINTSIETGHMIYVIGGAAVYYQVLRNYYHLIHNIHITTIDGDWECDTFFTTPFDLDKYFTQTHQKTLSPIATYTVMTRKDLTNISNISKEIKQASPHKNLTCNQKELAYLNLLEDVITNGKYKTGRNGYTKSVFGRNLQFDLRDGFPLITTRRVFFRGIVEELLFFLRGDTDTTYLESKNVNIWKGNTSKDFQAKVGLEFLKPGFMGPMYGYQWRSFGGEYDEETGRPRSDCFPPELELSDGVDQLADVVKLINEDPNSRRIMMTSYNPQQAKDGVLYPCHSIIIQFYVDDDELDMSVYNRSQDLALGVPFNIASSSLLLMIVAKMTDKIARNLIINMGDCHIYDCHIDAMEELITRIPLPMPTLEIKRDTISIKDIPTLSATEFVLHDYNYHPAIPMEMVA